MWLNKNQILTFKNSIQTNTLTSRCIIPILWL